MTAARRPEPQQASNVPAGPPPGHPAAPPPVEGPPASASGSALALHVPALAPATISTAAAAVAAQAKATVESRYLMALQRPRDLEVATRRLLAACDRPGFADEAMYARPVGKKKVQTAKGEQWEDAYTEGLSIRFAEEAARSWGNLMVESVVIHEDDDARLLRVTVTDLEVNLTYPFDVVVEKTVERKTLKRGQRALSSRVNSYGDNVHTVEATDDDVLMKQNALASKAMRTGVLRIIPADIQEECKRRIQATLAKAMKTEGATQKLVAAFAALGIGEEHLVGYLGHALETLSPKEYAELRGIGQAIKDGETTWEQVIADVPQTSGRAPRPVRSEGYDEGQPVKAEVKHMADRPVPKAPHRDTADAADEYHCTHGVPLADRCEECVADEAEA